MEPNQGVKTWQWIVTVIVIVILVILGYYMFKGKAEAPVKEEENTPAEQVGTEINRVVVADQYPGNVVYVTSAQFANPGFVVIKKDKDGMPGDIIGSAYFDKGINPGKVVLKEETKDGGTYYAVLYSDNGDKKFDEKTDTPLKNSKGSIIMQIFKATTNITEIKG